MSCFWLKMTPDSPDQDGLDVWTWIFGWKDAEVGSGRQEGGLEEISESSKRRHEVTVGVRREGVGRRRVIGCGHLRRERTKWEEEDFFCRLKSCPAGGSSTAQPVGCSRRHRTGKGKRQGWSESEMNCCVLCESDYQRRPRRRGAQGEARNAKGKTDSPVA